MSNSVSEEVSKQELILERLPYPHTVHKLFRIPLQLSDKISTALLDTGSVASFISTDIFYELSPKKIQDTKNESLVPHFRCAAGQVMEPVGYYSVPLTIEKKVHTRHPFYIVPTLQEGCILGMDFINQHKARIDADDETLPMTNDIRFRSNRTETPLMLLKKTERILLPFHICRMRNVLSSATYWKNTPISLQKTT